MNEVGPPETTAVCTPDVAQEIVNQGSVTVTFSLKTTEMSDETGTLVASSAGSVLETDGGVSVGVVEFSALGVFRASPGPRVPILGGMPARSKSFRTQSAGISVSVPLGMRDAPPGANGSPSYMTPSVVLA